MSGLFHQKRFFQMLADLLLSDAVMKKLMITGALLGLLIGAVFGLNEGSPWPAVIWRSCVASISAGFLLRWWGRVWIKCLHDAQAQRLVAAETKEQSLTHLK
jgi:hypothetical protein